MPSISLVIPAYNEAGSIEAVAEECLTILRKCADDYELIILDDASTDRTPTIIRTFQQRDPANIRLHFHQKNMGIAHTFEELYRLAKKDWVFLISGDGQFPPDALEKCLPLTESADVIICYRTCKHYTLYRHLISMAYRWCTVMLFGIDLFDPGSIKCIKRTLIDEIHVQSAGVYVEAERIIRAAKQGYSLARVNITPRRRSGGKARGARLTTVCRAAADMLALWWNLMVLRRSP